MDSYFKSPLNKTQMRNILFLIFGFFLLFLVSCGDNNKKTGPGISKTVETTVNCTENVPSTAPRFGCDGRRIEGQKITGWTTESTESTKTVPCNFSHEELADIGYTYTGTETRVSRPTRPGEEESVFQGDGYGLPWEWLGWLLFIAAGLAFLFLLLWLLRELLNWLMNLRVPSNPGNQHLVNHQTSAQQPNPIVSVSDPVTPAPRCPANSCACNQQALTILENMVAAKYSFTAPGNALVPENGIYAGNRHKGDDLRIDIFSPAPPPNEDEKPKSNVI